MPEKAPPRAPRPAAAVIGKSAALLLAAAAFASVFSAALLRAREDLTLVFYNAPRHIVPDGHSAQVRLFRAQVPKGSYVLYVMDRMEAWQLGLWQRSLYPDYVVIPVPEAGLMAGPEVQALRRRHQIRFALASGNPPPDPGFVWRFKLPDYPNGIPIFAGCIDARPAVE